MRGPLNRMKRFSFAAAMALVAATAGCGILDAEIAEIGTVRLINIEGGCWVIDVGEVTYLPTNLPLNLQQDGLRVEFEAESRPGIQTFCPGTVVQLRWIEAVPAGGG